MIDTPVSLLQRLRDPAEQRAWRRFVQLYTPLLHHWAVRLGLNPDDAADLVQDVFLVLVRKLPEFTYDQQKSFHGWLRTVLNNCWRAQGRRRRLPLQEADPNTAAEAAQPDAAEMFSETEYQQHLARRALELMRAEFQETTWRACWEHVVQGRSAEEVARELGISVNAVYIAKSRVLRHLREELLGLFD